MRSSGEQFFRDKQNATSKEKFTFIRTKKLLEHLNIDEATLRKRVHSIRLTLKQQFLEHIDYTLDEQDIIESHRWRGYRLNPYLVLVDAADLRRPGGREKSNESHDIC